MSFWKHTIKQLLLIAEHYCVTIMGDKRLKENIKSAIDSKLVEPQLFPAIKHSLETSPTSALPFSDDTATGDSVLSRGTWLRILPIPLHKVVLDCGLVKGEVAVGVAIC